MSFSIPSDLREILETLFVHSPEFLVSLVAILLILARGHQLPRTALCGFVILFIWPILQMMAHSFLLPQIDCEYQSVQQVEKWERREWIAYFCLNLIHAVAFGCLLHAIVRLVKRHKAHFTEASRE